MSDLQHLHHKRAKGRDYWYFDTGQLNEKGKPILLRLPHKRSSDFGGAYARALAARTARKSKRDCLTLDGLIVKYERSPEFKSKAANTQRSYSRYLARASKLIRGPRGESAPAAAIQPRDVVQVRDKLSSKPGAASQTVRAIGALYAWASKPENGYATINPAAKITLFKPGEHQPWPEALLEEALTDADVKLAVGFLYFTGQRIGDAVKAQRTAIQWPEIEVYAQKTKSRLRIYIHSELAALLKDAPRTATTILTNAQGRPWTANGLRQKLQKWAKDRGFAVVPHGLRKNAVNALFEAGCTAAEVSAITDHSMAMLEHYAKGRSQAKIGRAAIIKLEDHRAKRNGSAT